MTQNKKYSLSAKVWNFIVVFCIFVVLVAFILPLLKPRCVFRPPHLHSLYDLKQIGLSLKQYAMDNEDFFPPDNNSRGLEKLRSMNYLSDYDCYICPGTKHKRGQGPLKENNCSYIYLGGFKEGQNPKIPLAFDKPGNHKNFMTVLFIDGSTKRYSTTATKNCETIIIFLNKKYKYPRPLYERLLRKAQKIDIYLKKNTPR